MIMSRHDKKLLTLLLKRSHKWRAKFNGFENGEAAKLRLFFENYTTERRTLLLAYMDALEKGPGGVILDTAANRDATTKALFEIKGMQVRKFSKDSSFAKWVDRTYDKAGAMGVTKAKDSIKIGEGAALPRGYKPPTARLVNHAKSLTLRQLAQRNGADLDIVREEMVRHIVNPAGTVQELRGSLEKRGQIEGITDTLGRRITASERADRIAKYELSNLSTETQQATINDIYNDGEADPHNTFRLWNATLDGRHGKDSARRNGQILSEYQWSIKEFGDRYKGLPPLRARDRCDDTLVRPEWFSPQTRQKYFGAKVTKPLQQELAA